MKKILLFYVAVVFTVVTSFAQQTFTSEGFNFQVSDTDNPQATVTGRAEGNTATDITIPATATFNGITYAVTSIGDEAFLNNESPSIIIGENEMSTENQLISVDIPDSITSIGDAAFRGNDLTSVVIPEGVTSVGAFAFSGNELTSLDIPESVISIGDDAFSANKLVSVVIPSSLINIEDGVFAGNELTSVDIPESVVSIGDAAFLQNKLTSIDIPTSVTIIKNAAFASNQLLSVTIPANVTSIGEGAFLNNLISSVIISGDVLIIAESVFSFNPITEVTSLSINPANIDNNDPFSDLDRSAITLTIPGGTTQTYRANGWTGFTIEEDVALSTTDTGVSLKDNFVVLTNPNSISVKSSGIATINVQELAIYAMSGKKIATSTAANISTESLANGVYLLRIVTDKGAITKKIIK